MTFNVGLTSGTAGSIGYLNPTSTTLSVGTASVTSTANSKWLALDGTTAGNTVTGIISNGIGTFNLAKSNTSSWTISGANTYSGTTAIYGGTLTITGTNSGTGLTQINGGTMIIQGAKAATGPVTFFGAGTLNFNEAAGSSQANGALTFSSGDGILQSTYSGDGSQNTTLTFSSLAARVGGATGNFVVSGGTNGTTNKIVLTGVTANSFLPSGQGYFFGGNNYAWYDLGGYVRAISYSGTPDTSTESVTTTATAFAGTTLYGDVTGSGQITGQTTGTVTTIKIENSNPFGIAGTLSTNGILLTGGNTVTISGGNITPVATGNDLVIRTYATNDNLTISTPILQNGATANALGKSGAGTLTLTGSNTYTGRHTSDRAPSTLTGQQPRLISLSIPPRATRRS